MKLSSDKTTSNKFFQYNGKTTLLLLFIAGALFGQVSTMAITLAPPHESSDALIDKISCDGLKELYAEDFEFKDNFRHFGTTPLGGIHNDLVGQALEERCDEYSLFQDDLVEMREDIHEETLELKQ